MVCFGGSDEKDFTGKSIEQLLVKESPKEIVAVVGDAYRYREELERKGISVCCRLYVLPVRCVMKQWPVDVKYLLAITSITSGTFMKIW